MGSMPEAPGGQPPIPGRGPLGDPREPVQALVRFYRAFNERDLGSMEAIWDHTPDIVAMSPLVGLVRGWPTLREGYERMFQGADRIETEFYDYSLHEAGEHFFALGRERGRMIAGGRTLEVTGQATNIFRRAGDGSWKLIHHHVSLSGPPVPAAPAAGATGR
jgi:ketosteroid isomerase-like protein